MKKWFTSADAIAFLGALLFAGVFAMYLQTYHFEFINLDDFDYTMTCPFVNDGFTWANFQAALTTFTYGAIWMPLTWLSYMLEISLVGHDPGAMHITSGFLHACNALWLFLLLVTVLGGKKTEEEQGASLTVCLAAAVAAAFWAVHPLRAESAAWVASRKDVVFLFFELPALIFWVRYVKAGNAAPASRASCVNYGLSILFFLLACMGKPMAMTFPVLACLLEFLLNGRIRWRGIILPGIIGVACGLMANYSQTVGGGTGQMTDTTAIWRLLNAIAAFGQYCLQTVWPSGLHMLYPPRFPAPPDHLFFGLMICALYAIVMLAALLPCLPPALIGRSLSKVRSGIPVPVDVCRLVFAGLAWFLLSIGPALGITANFGWHSHADRFTYLPAIGFSILLAGLLGRIGGRRIVIAAMMWAILATACVGYLGYRQIGFWKNDIVVFDRGYQLSKPNAQLDQMLAMAYLKVPGKLDEVYRILNESVQTSPNDKNLGALGFVLALKGETPEQMSAALEYAKRSYELNPEEPMSTATLGLVALRKKDWKEANRLLEASVRNSKNPQAPVLEWLGMARYNLKDYPGAVWAFNQACMRMPNDPNLRQKLEQAEKKLSPGGE